VKSLLLAGLLLIPFNFFGDRQGVPLCAVAAQQDPHGGQPATCNNYHSNEKPCACHRATECPERDENGKKKWRPEDPKCQVYCRPDACKCTDPCDT